MLPPAPQLLLQALKDEPGSGTPPPHDGRCHEWSPSVESGLAREMLEAWLFPARPSGRDHVVLTGPEGPAELWELVWEHGAFVLVSLCPPDPQEERRSLLSRTR
ncbi:receptor-type tyrosine-protein phosphatase V-like isoform X2 [Odocoileus virginianus]|uniref:Receptor-type tyrosine-protein phosphatase V-like isoform X2 n=1 Tax=Odocoileus virginianus TaxID=9874 RepID=A0ABM4IPZ2_ODOVR